MNFLSFNFLKLKDFHFHILFYLEMMSKKLKLVKELKEVATKIDRALISLNFAIGEGKLEVVKRFIMNCSDINEVDDDGQTILFQATKHGHESIVQLLLDHGCDPNVVDQSQDTVLHLAAKNGNSNPRPD